MRKTIKQGHGGACVLQLTAVALNSLLIVTIVVAWRAACALATIKGAVEREDGLETIYMGDMSGSRQESVW